ncbi:MAG TPA: tyrosine-type recombinase/integrase [Bacilli bacterium]|nr:tyrosine-type recombinase/integrase [Bacilli bacterium]
MGVYKDSRPTKDGKVWFFKIQYEDFDGTHKTKKSGRFATKKEAEDAEFDFKLKLHEEVNQNDMTFEDIIKLFLEFKKKRVRENTVYGYGNKLPYLKMLYKVKLKDFSYSHYERWHDYINSKPLATKTKNDIYKFLKSILNYATAWYEFNFVKVYPKMTNFNNPNELPKEQLYFTYEEFKQFLSVETDIRWIAVYEILYYCGLRRGELRGLQWKDINFSRRTLSISKQITDRCGSVKNYRFALPKTQNSIRTLKMPEVLTNSLKSAQNEAMKISGYNDNFFIAGDAFPVSSNALTERKNSNCKLAGVKQIRLHDFRHSCASLLINKGANVQVVAKYLGHTKIEETLKTYSHLFLSSLDEIVDVIDDLEK